MIRMNTVLRFMKNSRLCAAFCAFALSAIGMILPPLAHAAPDAVSCATDPAHRALDFWLGDWTIAAPGAPADANSAVSTGLGECVVVEHWSGEVNHTGENIFGYSADDQSWHGFFADSKGHLHVFLNGTVASGVAQFTGPNRGPDGETVLNRITIRRIDADHVEQMWEKSSDGGKTWSRQFLLQYTRKH